MMAQSPLEQAISRARSYAGAGGSAAEQGAGNIPLPTDTSGSVQSPIGVPYYVTDPNTGQPLLDANGQPVRWQAPVQVTPTGPGSLGTQGPGTAPSSGVTFIQPRYFTGDEWLPASLPPEQVAQLQRKMVAAGLLKQNEAQLGVWDVSSMQAYQKLLAYANASGLDAQSALDRWGTAHAADPNAGKAPLQTQVSNPDDLRQVFRKAIIDTLGQGWSQDKIDSMVNAYQQQEVATQTAAYNTQDTGGQVQQVASPTDFAQAQALKEEPIKAQEHSALDFFGQFKQMVGGWSGGQ